MTMNCPSASRAGNAGRVATIWDDAYRTDAAPTNSTSKQAEVVAAARAEGLLDCRPWTFSRSLAWASVEAVHEAGYVRAVRSGRPRALAESQGFTWSPAFAEAVVRTWRGHGVACQLALAAGTVFHPVSGAHHARREHGSGFCTFNFLVGAARELLADAAVGRVAIIDLDAHQGDGTYELAHEDARIGLFDVAGQNWVGEVAGKRVVLSVARSADQYSACLARLPAFLDTFAPDLVQYQAGVDCHETDPVGGIQGVNADFLAWRDRLVIGEVVRRGIPLVINLAGGYQGDGLSVALHLQTVRAALCR